MNLQWDKGKISTDQSTLMGNTTDTDLDTVLVKNDQKQNIMQEAANSTEMVR